jgi:phosphinothricin acetyltransferase
MIVRVARADDADAIADIYRPYVSGTVITFEDDAPPAAEIRTRMAAGGGLYPWFVAEADNMVAGYAYAAAFRTRTAYRFAVETTVYVREGCGRRGIGRALYAPLLQSLEEQGFTQAIAAISLPNADSVGFHEALGFVHAGTYRRVGWKLGRWIDVGLWQRPLAAERSPPAEPRRFSGYRPEATI